MQLIDYLGYLGLLVSLGVAIAGWFWEFSKKNEDGTRKKLTKAGKYALTATLMVAVISIISTINQGIERQRAATAAIGEKERMKTQLHRLITQFDLDTIDVWLRLDNGNELVRKLKGNNDSAVVKVSSGDSLINLTQEQIDALFQILKTSSEIGLLVYPHAYTGDPFNINASDFTLWVRLDGKKIEDIPIKWSIISWRHPKTFTDIELTIPASIVDIPGGLRSIRSFSDLASKTVFATSGVTKSQLLSLQLYSKNRVAYPIVAASQDGGKPLPIGDGVALKVEIPKRPPWIPE